MQKQLFENIKAALVEYVSSIEDAEKIYQDPSAWNKVIKKLCEKAVLALDFKDFKGCNKQMLSLKHDYLDIDSLFVENLRKDATLNKTGAYQTKIDGVDFYLYQRKPRIAIGYESEKSSFADKADKLSHLRCDLKVIVAYSIEHGDSLDYVGLAGAKMSMVHGMIKACEIESLSENWLIIILPKKTLDPSRMLGFTMDRWGYKKI